MSVNFSVIYCLRLSQLNISILRLCLHRSLMPEVGFFQICRISLSIRFLPFKLTVSIPEHFIEIHISSYLRPNFYLFLYEQVCYAIFIHADCVNSFFHNSS